MKEIKGLYGEKKRVNISLTNYRLAQLDLLAKKYGMNRSQFLEFLIEKEFGENGKDIF